MSDFNFALVDFEDVLEYVGEMVGEDFISIITIANHIIDNPSEFTGVEAIRTAKKLAAYRVKLGADGSYMKLKTPQTKSTRDRLIKEAVLVMYDSLLELINCLKLTARQELL